MKFGFIIFIFLALPKISFAAELIGMVVKVSDGDSITVLADNIQHKVRLGAIDAPERWQAFGSKSRKSLAELIAGQMVLVDYNKRDKYDRIVGKVLLQDMDVGLEQVRRGMAWHYKQYEQEQDVEDRSAYAQAEYLAQHDQLGLWADSHPIPPWEFRRNH